MIHSNLELGLLIRGSHISIISYTLSILDYMRLLIIFTINELSEHTGDQSEGSIMPPLHPTIRPALVASSGVWTLPR